MRFLRVGEPGAERPVVIDDADVTYDLSTVTVDIDGAFLAGDGIAATRRALADGTLDKIDISGLRLGPPVARPHAVWCIGMNYAAHAAESGAQPPEVPSPVLQDPEHGRRP